MLVVSSRSCPYCKHDVLMPIESTQEVEAENKRIRGEHLRKILAGVGLLRRNHVSCFASATFLHNMTFKHTDHNSMMLYPQWPWPSLHLWVVVGENHLPPWSLLIMILPWVQCGGVGADNKPFAYEQRNCHCYAPKWHLVTQHDGHLEPKKMNNWEKSPHHVNLILIWIIHLQAWLCHCDMARSLFFWKNMSINDIAMWESHISIRDFA
jgi:hypothetical protein